MPQMSAAARKEAAEEQWELCETLWVNKYEPVEVNGAFFNIFLDLGSWDMKGLDLYTPDTSAYGFKTSISSKYQEYHDNQQRGINMPRPVDKTPSGTAVKTFEGYETYELPVSEQTVFRCHTSLWTVAAASQIHGSWYGDLSVRLRLKSRSGSARTWSLVLRQKTDVPAADQSSPDQINEVWDSLLEFNSRLKADKGIDLDNFLLEENELSTEDTNIQRILKMEVNRIARAEVPGWDLTKSITDADPNDQVDADSLRKVHAAIQAFAVENPRRLNMEAHEIHRAAMEVWHDAFKNEALIDAGLYVRGQLEELPQA